MSIHKTLRRIKKERDEAQRTISLLHQRYEHVKAINGGLRLDLKEMDGHAERVLNRGYKDLIDENARVKKELQQLKDATAWLGGFGDTGAL